MQSGRKEHMRFRHFPYNRNFPVISGVRENFSPVLYILQHSLAMVLFTRCVYLA